MPSIGHQLGPSTMSQCTCTPQLRRGNTQAWRSSLRVLGAHLTYAYTLNYDLHITEAQTLLLDRFGKTFAKTRLGKLRMASFGHIIVLLQCIYVRPYKRSYAFKAHPPTQAKLRYWHSDMGIVGICPVINFSDKYVRPIWRVHPKRLTGECGWNYTLSWILCLTIYI